MKIEVNRWYRVLIDGQEHIVRIDGRIMKYCVVDYYDARLWYTGGLGQCKKFISEHIQEGFYDKEGGSRGK